MTDDKDICTACSHDPPCSDRAEMTERHVTPRDFRAAVMRALGEMFTEPEMNAARDMADTIMTGPPAEPESRHVHATLREGPKRRFQMRDDAEPEKAEAKGPTCNADQGFACEGHGCPVHGWVSKAEARWGPKICSHCGKPPSGCDCEDPREVGYPPPADAIPEGAPERLGVYECVDGSWKSGIRGVTISSDKRADYIRADLHAALETKLATAEQKAERRAQSYTDIGEALGSDPTDSHEGRVRRAGRLREAETKLARYEAALGRLVKAMLSCEDDASHCTAAATRFTGSIRARCDAHGLNMPEAFFAPALRDAIRVLNGPAAPEPPKAGEPDGDVVKRAPGCTCLLEEGDSECPVHNPEPSWAPTPAAADVPERDDSMQILLDGCKAMEAERDEARRKLASVLGILRISPDENPEAAARAFWDSHFATARAITAATQRAEEAEAKLDEMQAACDSAAELLLAEKDRAVEAAWDECMEIMVGTTKAIAARRSG